VVKSHGSATAAGVANAVAVAARLLEEDLTQRIAADLAELGETRLRDNRGGKNKAEGQAA
jgi:phosphate acyltransferase